MGVDGMSLVGIVYGVEVLGLEVCMIKVLRDSFDLLFFLVIVYWDVVYWVVFYDVCGGWVCVVDLVCGHCCMVCEEFECCWLGYVVVW